MHVVVLYATIEGQTRKVARNIAGTVQSAGHDVTVFDAADIDDIDLGAADALIVAAPVHVGAYPAALSHWLKTNSDAVNETRSAFVSISLAMASTFPEEHREIAQITKTFLENVGWKPAAVHQAAGALRYLEYDFLKRLLLRQFAKKEGGPLDMSKNHEFTDWDELSDFVNGFLEKATA